MYFLIGILLLITWLLPFLVVALVVIGVYKLIVYFLNENNVKTQDTVENISLQKDSKLKQQRSSIKPIIEHNINKQTLYLDEIKESQIHNTELSIEGNIDEKSNVEKVNVDCLRNRMPEWENYHFSQKQKVERYRLQGKYEEEVLVIEETINSLEKKGIYSAYWNLLHERAKRRLNLCNTFVCTEENVEVSLDFENSIKFSNRELNNNPCKKELMEVIEDVPRWEDKYIWSIEDLQSGNKSQQRFYKYFKEQFLNGHYLDIKGNTNYAFLLMFDLNSSFKSNAPLLKEYYKHLIQICPRVEKYTKNIIKENIVDVKRTFLKNTLNKYPTNLQGTCKWINCGEKVEIGGILLNRGGFYLGECFKLPRKVLKENNWRYNCNFIYGPVVNPLLPISKGFYNDDDYFCSYQDMMPTQRYEYLQWLSGVSPIVEISIDIIEYYIYGLEIRLFIDESTNSNERKQIILQLIELNKQILNLDRNVFAEYYRLMYNIKGVIISALVKYFSDSATNYFSEEELMLGDDYVDYIINHDLKGKTELMPEDAYRIAKKICILNNLPILLYEDKIKERFISLFQQKYNKHSIVNNSEYFIRNEHTIKMPSISLLYCSEDVYFKYDLPETPIDDFKVKFPIKEIVRILEEDFWLYNICSDKFNCSAPLALLQLPKYIDLKGDNNIILFQKYIESILDKYDYSLVDVDSLLKRIGYVRNDEKSLYLNTIQAITNALQKLRVRIVPLIDIDSKRLNFGDNCILYRINDDSEVERTEIYSRLELFVRLAGQIIQVDGCNDNDFRYIDNFIDSKSDTLGNAIHLKAYSRWLQNKKQPLDKKTKDSIVKTLNKEQCKNFATAMLTLTCSQGDVNHKRVEILTKIFPLLGEDINNIHSQIHRMMTDDEDFAIVEVKKDAKEYVISQSGNQSRSNKKNVKIDTVKLSKLEAQTISAQKMLSEIFSDEEVIESKVSSNQTPLIAILTRLLTRSEWSKEEVDTICREYNVITGSILEQINDYSYDKIDDAVLDEDDGLVFVNVDYKDILI